MRLRGVWLGFSWKISLWIAWWCRHLNCLWWKKTLCRVSPFGRGQTGPCKDHPWRHHLGCTPWRQAIRMKPYPQTLVWIKYTSCSQTVSVRSTPAVRPHVKASFRGRGFAVQMVGTVYCESAQASIHGRQGLAKITKLYQLMVLFEASLIYCPPYPGFERWQVTKSTRVRVNRLKVNRENKLLLASLYFGNFNNY